MPTTTRVYAINLWADPWPAYGPDGYETNYLGCWHVPCPDSDPRLPALTAANFGRFLDEDGTLCRAFFLPDELDEQLAAAEAETGCYADAHPVEGAA